MISRYATAGLAALALSACGQASEQPDVEPEPTESAEDETPAEDSVSIIRPDADVERQAELLEPLRQRISFDEGGSTLGATAKAELAQVLQSPQFDAGGRITLRGHTDSEGADAANLRASQRRAEAVRDWLVENGVSEGRIRVIAMGEQNPARPNAKADGSPDEAGRAFNRRVDLSIAIPAELAAPRPEDEKPTLVEQVSGEN
ncbi:OmpA family protein [Altererythrobacter aquaemixtae]|uniref:OmpA family protein n=2 Tax=Pontixanthobacter aquaemixtae TaxID=1958940 RepID=A0A844ZTT7_9SPHN|nr:OmpA family protein [Pontixanthobacter aquaemixtae]